MSHVHATELLGLHVGHHVPKLVVDVHASEVDGEGACEQGAVCMHMSLIIDQLPFNFRSVDRLELPSDNRIPKSELDRQDGLVAAHVCDQVAHRHHRRVKHSQVTLD